MKPQDNNLRAPAEGFGQDVTFAFRPDAPTPQLDGLGRSGQSRGGVDGSPVAGPVAHAQAVAPIGEHNPTIAFLSKAVGAVMAPRIKAAKAAAFVQGMQRAAGGEAVKDIAEGQPWYATIFGDSDVVEGARAYATQAKVSDAMGALEDSMPELRRLDGSAANAHYNQLVSKSLTGDDVTDASLMQAFARTMPATMRRQAKEHYAWRQEEASKAESSAFLSSAALLQKRAATPSQTPDEYATEAVKFFAGMRPAVGRDVESWTKARTQDMLELAQSGQFHSIGVIRQSGLLQQLPAQARTQIETALDAAENRTIARKSFEYADIIGSIAGQAKVFQDGMSPDDFTARMSALNERFRYETGIDRDLITMDKGSGVVSDVWSTILREGDRRIRDAETRARAAGDKQDKALAKQVEISGALGALALGQAAAARRTLPDSVVDKAMLDIWRNPSAFGVKDPATFLVSNYTGNNSGDGFVHPGIRHMYETRSTIAAGAPMTGEFTKLYGEWLELYRREPGAADAYFGKNADRMAYFHSLLRDGNPGDRGEAEAHAAAFASDPPRPKHLSEEQQKKLPKTLGDMHESHSIFFGSQRIKLDPGQAAQYAHAAEPYIRRFLALPGETLESAAKRGAEAMRREQGADVVGGYFIAGYRGQQPLSSILRTMRPGDSAKGTGDDAPGYWDKAVRGALFELAERHGVPLDNTSAIGGMVGLPAMNKAKATIAGPVQIHRGEDVNGVAQLAVYFTGKDGNPIATVLTSDGIKNFARYGHTNAVHGKVKTE
jgi:hypothetical protein